MEIILKSGVRVTFSESDAEIVHSYSWWAERRGNTFYARGIPKGKGASKADKVYMHRLLMSAKKGDEVDHIDMHGLNNTRENLRLVTRGQNGHNKNRLPSNTSGAKGVHFNKERNKWFAKITYAGREYKRGYFNTASEAATAYEALARTVAGEYHRTDSNYDAK